ncbi:MAG: enoyl-CoA hydratase [Gammaproteobacteria bacterium]|nr:enoyl-CoA hydratase [Gammaproteobacteria bacterium]
MSALVNESTEPVLLKQSDNGITRLTLNRPGQYNSLSKHLLSELQTALDEIATDESQRVVIIAANGKAFCAGHDLKEMRSSEKREFHQALFEQCGQMMQTIASMPQPVIAQVNGIATAAGCQLVAQCDLAVTSDVSRFAVSGINVGLFCSTPAVPLSRNMHRKQAMQMLLTGDFVDATVAREYGLVNTVTSENGLEAETLVLAEKIAAKSPLAIKMGKRMFYQQLSMGLDKAYDFAGETMTCNMNSEDAREGIDAFIEKRKPTWQGR